MRLEREETADVKGLIEKLKAAARDEGCTLAELIERNEGGEDAGEELEAGEGEESGEGAESAGAGKVSMIIARMKAKRGAAEA